MPKQLSRLSLWAACGIFSIAFATCAAAQDATARYRAAVEQRFDAWLSDLRLVAASQGITPDTFDYALKGVTLDWSLPDLAPPDLGEGYPQRPRAEVSKRQKQQAEFDRPSRYFPQKSLQRAASRGRGKLEQWKDTLEKIENRFGVQPHVVLAIWGRETSYGRARLPHYAVRALATQAFIGRRTDYFRKQLMMALQILQERHVSRGGMRSSWAGAMGHTQFLPSDFHNYAVDFDGDGRRDIWTTIPDALASTANFLRKNGWEQGKTWGYEVRLPPGFDCTLEGIANARSIGEWTALGVTRTFDRAFPPERLAERAHIVAPAGSLGPAFLVLDNFEVFRAYNKADLYALYVGHLADRILFDSEFEGDWTRVQSFSRLEVRRLQEAMAQAGYDIGKIDGLIGSRTRSMVGKWQRSLGREVTCYPRRSLLKHAGTVQKQARDW